MRKGVGRKCQFRFNLFTLHEYFIKICWGSILWETKTNGADVFCFLSSLPISILTPPHPSHLGLLTVISLLLTKTVPRACLSIGLERFCGNQKEDERGPPSINSSKPKTEEGLYMYCKRPIQCLASSAFGAGGGQTRWVERGWGSIVRRRQTLLCTLYM